MRDRNVIQWPTHKRKAAIRQAKKITIKKLKLKGITPSWLESK